MTEYVEGKHVTLWSPEKIRLDPSIKSSPELIESLEKIKTVIKNENIADKDFQIRISTQNKAVVIDPEYTRAATTLAQVESNVRAIDNLILKLKTLKPKN